MSRLAHRGLIAWLAFGLSACSSDGSSSTASGGDPPATVSQSSEALPSSPDRPILDTDEVDAGFGGLEFDPSSKRLLEAAARPRPFKPGSALPIDVLAREEQPGLVLEAVFRHRELGSAPENAEASQEGLDAALKLTEPRWRITLTNGGRMKAVFDSRAMALPFGSELRARYDRLGHLILWPGATRYRVVASGALRTTLGERRVDMTQLSTVAASKAEAGKRLDYVTRGILFESPLGKLRLELAAVPEAGLGGPLLCRALVELVGVDPATTSECRAEEVPLRAEISWANSGGIDFDVTSLVKRIDLPPGEVMVPPPGPEASLTGLPEAPDGIFLTRAELAAFRKKALTLEKPKEGPAEGLTADNGRDQWLMLFLDGVAVVGVPAHQQRYVVGPLPGRYQAEWRSFLGDHLGGNREVELPGLLRSAPPPPAGDAGL